MQAKRLFLAGFILGIYCLTALADEEDALDDREPKEYMPEVWHAIETIPEGSTGWIPRDPLDSLGKAQTKRRRLRKRKRRPPVVTYLDQSAESPAPILAQEPSKPQDAWKDMQEESGRPYVRRKVTPAYSPLAAAPEDQNRSKAQGPNIKDILKQSGGLSLSEILQQKNVSLAELLMGKEEAIQALTERTKYKRIPPSIGLHKEGISRRYETVTESQDVISSREREEAQKKRLALLQSHNFPEVTRQEAATDPVTEAREETSTTSGPSTAKPPDGNRVKTGLPLTSAQLMKMVTKTKAVARPLPTPPPEDEENYPKMNGTLFKPLKISVKEIGKYSPENQPGEKLQDGPLRMTIDLKTVDFAPKLEPSSAREEILQILTDPVGRAGLARILEARNMSVQELIEQRERGSSQLHLADIFHNNTREPEPSDEALEGKINSEVFSSLPVFARQPKSLPSPTTEQPVPTMSFKIPANSSTNATRPWQRLYPGLFSRPNQKQQPKDLEPHQVEEERDILTEEDVQRLDDVDQTLYSSISTQQLNIDENPWQMLNISTGVRSAIVASLVIVLLSIVVFVSILVVFRWRQSRKNCLDYGGSLKPALISIKRHNLKTFVAETLGKKNVNYYKRHLQSMSDDSWETESKGRV